MNILYKIIKINPLLEKKITRNDSRRCYFCKKMIFQTIKDSVKNEDYNLIVDGTNASDLEDYRPGIKALQELNIESPFAQLGITKKEVRKIATSLGLKISNKPVTTCLATRIAYNENITLEKLQRTENAEMFIKAQINPGNIRVRTHGNIARIEITEKDFELLMKKNIRDRVLSKLKKLGFSFITIDLECYRSGSMNNIIGL